MVVAFWEWIPKNYLQEQACSKMYQSMEWLLRGLSVMLVLRERKGKERRRKAERWGKREVFVLCLWAGGRHPKPLAHGDDAPKPGPSPRGNWLLWDYARGLNHLLGEYRPQGCRGAEVDWPIRRLGSWREFPIWEGEARNVNMGFGGGRAALPDPARRQLGSDFLEGTMGWRLELFDALAGGGLDVEDRRHREEKTSRTESAGHRGQTEGIKDKGQLAMPEPYQKIQLKQLNASTRQLQFHHASPNHHTRKKATTIQKIRFNSIYQTS